MALRVLRDCSERVTPVSASVCVMGAGIAGLVAATRLAREKNRRVVVVESGLRKLEPALDALNQIEIPQARYQRALNRFRGLGGNSHLWDGKLLPLARHDAAARPYLDLPGWPFDIAELDRYLPEIESLLGVDQLSYEEEVSDRLDPASLLPRQRDELVLRWAKRLAPANQNLATLFRREIESLDNLEIWLGATAARFDFDPLSGKVNTLTAVNHAGQKLAVTAGQYLIAAGTLESTRLLLLADRQSQGALSREGQALGRYFNDHLGLDAGILRPADHAATNRMLNDRSILGSQRHLHFELSGEVQEKYGVGSAYLDAGAELPESSALLKAKKVAQSLKRCRLDFGMADIQELLADSPSLLHTAQWQWLRQQKYWPKNATIKLKLWAEQTPQWQNRVSLSHQHDALGMPVLKLEWDKSGLEEKTLRTAIETMDRYWKRHLASTFRIEWNPQVLDGTSRLVDLTRDLAHPAGSTRMGLSPADSVVNADLRVHQIPNVRVASASVFPASGSANPTLTILQLALRAADAIKKDL
jgi:choline dehydrogenase-like flavoprotein